jgi:hypothetical protein
MTISSVPSYFLALLDQLAGVFQRSHRVVDGARPDDDEQAVVLALDDVVDAFAGFADQRLDGGAANREKADEMLGRG